MKNYTFLFIGLFLFISQSNSQNIIGKLTVGYQGWFVCENDGSPKNKWKHWNTDSSPSPGNIRFELYPDVSEYATLYQTGLGNLRNGQAAKLFSSYDNNVVNKHFEWMKTYGIDCAALQRFGIDLDSQDGRDQRNGMAKKVRNAAQTYGRKFYIMYDISTMSNSDFVSKIKNDWTNTIKSSSALNLLASSAYAKEKVSGVSKPVVAIWGIGSAGRPGDETSWKELISWFKTQGCYVIAGVPKGWRSKTEVKNACLTAHMVHPWHVTAFTTISEAKTFYDDTVSVDMDVCKNNGVAYVPTIWPGFAWSNWGTNPDRNWIPRVHGDFMWTQFHKAKQKFNAKSLIATGYVAMFDEYDEATAIAKAAENSSMIPNNQYFLTLDADGTACSSDFYLRLTRDGAKMLRGAITLSATHPTAHKLNTSARLSVSSKTGNSFTIYPNPTQTTLNISSKTTIDKIIVTDLTGKKVLDQNQNTTQVNVQNLAKGIYILEVYMGEDKETRKFIKG